ncbi:hypothetical protein ACU57_10380, partial [Escherichia coli]
MPTKMRTTRNLLLMATLLGSALFARAAEKEMTIGAIYLDTQGYYAGVGNDSNLLIVFYVQIMPDDFV